MMFYDCKRQVYAMMKYFITLIFTLTLLSSFIAPALAQVELDAVSKKAAQLEAEVGKMLDTTPRAAELLIELTDLYHKEGRVFGLIRAGQKFITAQPNHPKHKEVMLKLLDGLVILSRNKDIIATSRQFISRYPTDKACIEVEKTLARTLEQQNDRKQIALAYEAIWKRSPGTERSSAEQAVSQYMQMNNNEGFAAAARLGKEMVEKLPAGEYTSHAGWEAFHAARRTGDYAGSNAIGLIMLKKNLPMDPARTADFHRYMAENYANSGQRTNAVESLKKARVAKDSDDLHRRLILEMYHTAVKAPELEQVVNEYMSKYPNRDDRWASLTLLAHAYSRDGDKPHAANLFAQSMVGDPWTHDPAGTFVSVAGDKPEDFAKAEKVLLDALAKNPSGAAAYRYALAFPVYRDRIKDLGKSRAICRDQVTQSPTNDDRSWAAVHHLLTNPASPEEFNSDVKLLAAAASKNANLTSYRSFIERWVREVGKNKEHKDNAKIAKAAYDQIANDQWFKDWEVATADKGQLTVTARDRLLAGENYKKLSDEQARWLLRAQGYFHQHYAAQKNRPDSIGYYAKLCGRLPQDYEAATWWLQASTDYGNADQAREAALHLMKLAATVNDIDSYARLATAADKGKDVDLLKKSLAWILAQQQKLGLEGGNMHHIGAMLDKHGLKDEAMKYWRDRYALAPWDLQSRAAVGAISERITDGKARIAFLEEAYKNATSYHGAYATWIADLALKAGDVGKFSAILKDTRKRQAERPFQSWGVEEQPAWTWLSEMRDKNNKTATDDLRKTVFTAVRDLDIGRVSAAASLSLLEMEPADSRNETARLLAYAATTTQMSNSTYDWDIGMGYAQSAMSRKDYPAAATLLTGMLANVGGVDAARQKTGRDMVGQSFSRLGSVGLAIDDKSPIAPLLQAAMYLRLGDEKLAFDAYDANRKLFDEHRFELPVDLILFVCESHIAAGGDENYERAEDILRSWFVKFSDSPNIDDSTKAKIQLLLGKNYFGAKRYEVARAEFTSIMNRFAKTPEALEAEFGIGETFMAQKLFDEAEKIFEKLGNSRERDVVVRAEFLRGLLAHRRGDRDAARDIFRSVLERVPNISLANQTLFNLSEVYGDEQRYIEQLELLNTVGRLGRASKRWHTPGSTLSIVVQDSDLGISRGHTRIPVLVTTLPGGDQETIYLTSGGAGKGLFRADLPTQLGVVTKGDKVLQLTGRDVIKCDYPEQFKAEFKNIPLADAEIRIAADGKFEASSSKIIDEEQETFSQKLAREEKEDEAEDERISQRRPKNQVKPGNVVYLRVQDFDRDLSDQADDVLVKLVATSGDQVQVSLKETGPHTGLFEGTALTGELPAGALASDSAIDRNPLMAIDLDKATSWQSEPDGQTPKWLSVDMKDLKRVSQVTISTPDANKQAPVRGELQGSHDGRFWFRLASNPPVEAAMPVKYESGAMTMRLYTLKQELKSWKEIVAFVAKQADEEKAAETLAWTRSEDEDEKRKANYAILWHGKFVQPKDGAVRFTLTGSTTALVVNGVLELDVDAKPSRFADVWLPRGIHDITAFATAAPNVNAVSMTRARESLTSQQVTVSPFRKTDFDLATPEAKLIASKPKAEAQAIKSEVVVEADGTWKAQFEAHEVRYVRFLIHEYKGEAVAINHVEIRDDSAEKPHIPTAADVLALASNDTLEIAAGDRVTASYTDDFTFSVTSASDDAVRNRVLTATLDATYFNAKITPIAYDFDRASGGGVTTVRKELIRIDPGERVIIEVTDYDMDQTAERDTVKVQVVLNDGAPIELVATETQEHSGIFTKELDTAAAADKDKLVVKAGDRIYLRYLDAQNTFPGHSVRRETVVYVNQPTPGMVRIIETRAMAGKEPGSKPTFVYLPPSANPENGKVANVAFEVPLTVEVIDQDRAKDSRSSIVVEMTTTDGAKVKVKCIISTQFAAENAAFVSDDGRSWALEEGRFVGQVTLQLGGKSSPDLVPLTLDMPRGLIGGPVLVEEVEEGKTPPAPPVGVTKVLNLTGKDRITASYLDDRRPDNQPVPLTAQGRLISNGTLAVTDRDYDKPIEGLHVGEKLFIRVVDADVDVSDDRDKVKVAIMTDRGESEVVELEETLAHSGVFTGSFHLKANEKPVANNLLPATAELDAFFGDTLSVKYVDQAASTSSGTLELAINIPIVVGTDGLVKAFSKVFGDETLAVETRFTIAESFFELFKSHRKLGRDEEMKTDLESGKRVLREVVEDYPDPKYVPRIQYLYGQFAQELQQWDEAIQAYGTIVKQYPEHALAPDAQYKLAQSYEEANRFDEALEAYVTLAATYPKSPLIASVMIRINEYFWNKQDFIIAASVGQKFLERFEGHQHAAKMAFRVGQCYYKAEQYKKAADAFDDFVKNFPDDELTPLGLFWSGESFRTANNVPLAFRRYNRCRWDFPESEAAKYARGRLALPEMLAQFEREADLDNDK